MGWGWKPGFRTSGMSSPTTEACDLPWVPARRLLAPNTIPAVGLEFVACGGAWPLGQLDYRTVVREGERLRKEVYGRGDAKRSGINPLSSETHAFCGSKDL